MDVKFIHTMASEINNISSQLTSASNKYTDIKSPGSGEQEMLTGDMRVTGTYVNTSKTGVNAGERVYFQSQLKSGFKFPPIVTATTVTETGNAVSRSSYAVINTITTKLITGEVVCEFAGDLSVYVNIIAIGVPE